MINVAGLAIGMTCCILLVVYINSELSFDRYHENGDRVYRLCMHGTMGSAEVTWPSSNAVTGPVLREDFPEVIEAVRFKGNFRPVVKYKNNRFLERRMGFAENSVFNVFSWPLIKGDPNSALTSPFSMVITESFAKKYFGDEEPIGKVLRFNDTHDYTVTGLVKDVPLNSHFVFDALCSFQTLYSTIEKDSPILTEWLSFNFMTYLLLEEGADYRELEKKFPALLERHAGEQMRKMGMTTEFFLQPLKEIRLYSPGRRGTGPIVYIYIFSAVALFILLIACFNFMNLSTARASKRALEVGIRKVMGADRRRLILQFLTDALLFSLMAMVLALILAEIALPALGSLIGSPLDLNVIEIPWLLPGLIGLTLFTALLAGSYPAFLLTAFQPIKVLKGNLKSGASGSRMRRILVVAQFVISITFIIGTFLIMNQLNYMKNKHPGFDKEHVAVLPMMDEEIKRMLPVIKEELGAYHGIISTAAASTIPGRGTQANSTIPEGFTEATAQLMDDINVDADFIPTLGMKIVQGRNFSKKFGTDEQNAVLINETAIKQYGWKEPLEKTIKVVGPPGPDGKPMWVPKKVIGVVKDIHVRTITRAINPLIINSEPDHPYNRYRFILVRLKPGDIAGTMDFLKRKWDELIPYMPFNSYFLDQAFDGQFRVIERSRTILSYFTFLAIFIACLGLLGMASFTAERRTKEIGIRKALGASASSVTLLLTKEFTKLVILANIFAWPIAYFVMDNWIQGFPYRVSIGIGAFILSGGIALLIALLTVSYQAVKAASSNPAEALKYE